MVRKIKHKKGMEKKPLIIAAVALVAVVILAVLLFFGQPSVGRAYFIPGDTFDKYQAGSEESLQFPLTAGEIITVKVGANIASKESVAFSFQMEYSPEHFEFINVVSGLDKDENGDEFWGTDYLRTSMPSIGKSTSSNRILFEHATFNYQKAITGSVHLADVNFRVLQTMKDPENIDTLIDTLIQFENINVLEMSEDSNNLILSYVPVKGEMPTCVSEVCGDNLDNDCDGEVDEDCAPETAVCTDEDGDGYCVEKGDCDDNILDDPSNCPTDPSIKPPCQVGPFKVCAYCKNPGVTDACDGYDNNCNGATDEDYIAYLGASCHNKQLGVCNERGNIVCDSEGTGVICNAGIVIPSTSEICDDNLDNDCDGEVDEDCAVLTVTLLGDSNGDESLNVLDIIAIVNYIISTGTLDDETAADVNCDGSVNVLDVIKIVNAIVTGSAIECSS
jgi:hypothetical protein